MNRLNRCVRPALYLLVFLAAGAALAQDVAQESKAAVLRRLYAEVVTGANFDLLATAFAPDFVWRQAGDRAVTLADWRADVVALSDALPDLTAEPDELLSRGEWAASLVRLNGTFDAPLAWGGATLTPNGDPIDWLQLDLVHFENGLAVEGYSERDTLGLQAQLGAGDAGPQAVAPVQASGSASTAQVGQAAQAGAAASAFTREQIDRFEATFDAFLGTAFVNPDFTALDPLLSDDFRLHRPQADNGSSDMMAWLARLKMALPDGALETPVVFVDDDFGAARLVIRGTFLGQWTDDTGVTVPPNNQQQTLSANLLVRFNADGEIAEAWLVYDRGDWATQFAASGAAAS